MKKIYVIHENDAWLPPLRAAFHSLNLPFEEWHVAEGRIDLSKQAPEGVFYNRMSASSFTRDHRYAPELTSVVLAWLEGQGRRVVNNSRALRLEVNKAAQYAGLENFGIVTPRTVVATNPHSIVEAAETFVPSSFLLKPNRGGTGHGVELFHSVAEVRELVASDRYQAPIDGLTLVQQYIVSPVGQITRTEFVGGKFLYAVRVDTNGGFELCPADHCVDSVGAHGGDSPRFSITDNVDASLIGRYERFLAANDIEIGAIEYITDHRGKAYSYDVNTNTNYNADAEKIDGRGGMRAVAEFLGRELGALQDGEANTGRVRSYIATP